MTTDIINRLRIHGNMSDKWSRMLSHEAANEIESLRQQLTSRDAEVALLRQQVTLLRDAMEAAWQDGYAFCGAEGLSDAQKQFQSAFAATEPGSTNQDKAALFKALGLVPWDNKPPACTDTVWIEPWKIGSKESKESK
jgi:hypothetical protein